MGTEGIAEGARDRARELAVACVKEARKMGLTVGDVPPIKPLPPLDVATTTTTQDAPSSSSSSSSSSSGTKKKGKSKKKKKKGSKGKDSSKDDHESSTTTTNNNNNSSNGNNTMSAASRAEAIALSAREVAACAHAARAAAYQQYQLVDSLKKREKEGGGGGGATSGGTSDTIPSSTQAALDRADTEVLSHACWALSHLCDGPSPHVQAVVRADVCRRLVQLLRHSSWRVVKPALRTIGNIGALCAYLSTFFS